MMKSNAVLRKLSPNAAKNWHQNSGAKRRDDINEMDMVWTWLYGARAVPLSDIRLVHDRETWKPVFGTRLRIGSLDRRRLPP